jgi:hypothetical protein
MGRKAGSVRSKESSPCRNISQLRLNIFLRIKLLIYTTYVGTGKRDLMQVKKIVLLGVETGLLQR